ncbi:MAG: CotH kinase family protein, partial [Saprospiraceae bacterium]
IFNKNNFYLYENPLTGKINYLPYDLDNTLGIDWIGIDWTTRNIYNWANSFGPRPLYKRLLSISEYKNRLSYYFSKAMETVYRTENLFPHIDSLKMKMDPWRALDVYADEDYGFDYNDYNGAFTHGLGNQVAHGLRGFITARRNTALAQLDLKNIFPIITERKHNYPNPTQEIVIKAKLEDDGFLATVTLQYYLDGSTNLTTVEMYDDGLHQDELAGDGIYAAILPALETESILQYSIQATDDTGLESQSPKCDFAPIFIGHSTYQLSINEVMASNTDAITDEFGEYEDWIEIYNAGAYPVFLGDKYLSDDLAQPDQWQLPDVTIQPGDFLLFWADKDEKQSLYHANFKLSADGEFVGLFDRANNNFAVIDSVSFPSLDSNEVYARLPNGTGDFQFITATPGESNEFVVSQNNLAMPSFRVFPNPTSDILQLQFEVSNAAKFQLQIHDLRGQLVVVRNEVERNVYSLSLKGEKLVAGIYFLTINFAEGAPVTRKIVLQ